jgi:nucleotide-binding universal stress UspA family protein
MPTYTQDGAKFSQAVEDFHEARRKAALESLLARLRGKRSDLLSYDEVRRKFRLIESSRRDLEQIPINKIVGSVNRYTDFTRSFLPRMESDAQRWAFVRIGVDTFTGLPPIEAYKVGDVYFVSDGHHRVSVAKEVGADSIEGYVIPVFSHVPLSPGDSPDDLILKAEYDEFLAKTHLDELRPGVNLLVTAPGQYQKLLEHIDVHRFFLGEKREKEVPHNDAVTDWYDVIYLPISEMIRERNLLRDFPGRSEADLYLWIMDYRQELSGGGLGWEVEPERAANAIVAQFSPVAGRRVPRIASKILNFITPEPFVTGPPPGSWRVEHQSPRRGDRLFDDILVTVPGGKKGWPAVRLAIEVARREEARLTGLHVPTEEDLKNQSNIPAFEEEFTRLCAEAGIAGRLITETGQVAELLCQRSPWVDLIAFRLNYPPPTQPFKRLRSGVRSLIRRCSSPILAVPDAPFHLNSALLAYGPGRKSDEALFVATYLAGRWDIQLSVVTARREDSSKKRGGKQSKATEQALSTSPTPLERARQYLELHDVDAKFIEETGDPAQTILLAAEEQSADFIIMGGYEANPLREGLFGSSVDRVLRSTRRPTLICR